MKYTNRLFNIVLFFVLVTTCFLEKSVLATSPSEYEINQARQISEGCRPNRDKSYFGNNGSKDFMFKRFYIRGDGACGPSVLGFKSRGRAINLLLKNAKIESFRRRVWQEIYDEWKNLPAQMKSSKAFKSAKTVVQKRNYAKSEAAFKGYVNHRLSDDDWYFLCQSGRSYFLDGLAYLQKLNLCVWSSRSDYPFQLTFVNGISSNANFQTRHMHLKGLHYSRLVEVLRFEEIKQALDDEDFQVQKLFYHLLAGDSQDVRLKNTSFSGVEVTVLKANLMQQSWINGVNNDLHIRLGADTGESAIYRSGGSKYPKIPLFHPYGHAPLHVPLSITLPIELYNSVPEVIRKVLTSKKINKGNIQMFYIAQALDLQTSPQRFRPAYWTDPDATDGGYKKSHKIFVGLFVDNSQSPLRFKNKFLGTISTDKISIHDGVISPSNMPLTGIDNEYGCGFWSVVILKKKVAITRHRLLGKKTYFHYIKVVQESNSLADFMMKLSKSQVSQKDDIVRELNKVLGLEQPNKIVVATFRGGPENVFQKFVDQKSNSQWSNFSHKTDEGLNDFLNYTNSLMRKQCLLINFKNEILEKLANLWPHFSKEDMGSFDNYFREDLRLSFYMLATLEGSNGAFIHIARPYVALLDGYVPLVSKGSLKPSVEGVKPEISIDQNGDSLKGTRFIYYYTIQNFKNYIGKKLKLTVPMTSTVGDTYLAQIYDGAGKISYSPFHPGNGKEINMTVEHTVSGDAKYLCAYLVKTSKVVNDKALVRVGINPTLEVREVI